jgi:glycine/D-amino acid oxidase-like deaminating enzyme
MSRNERQRLRKGRPVWLSGVGAPSLLRYAALKNRLEADVAIVGGGLTGALVAHTFAEAGASVVLLEAARVGRGSTAASSALLLQEPDHGMVQLAERYGRATSRRLWQSSRKAVRDFIALLMRLRIPCELVERDTIYYATDAAAVERLRREFGFRTRAGFKAEWLGPGAIREATAIAARAAIRTSGSAQLNPYRACLGLAGARIFEGSPVRRITQTRDGVRVHTASGRVDAKRVVVATGYATARFRPLAGRFRMYRTYVLASPPLSPSERQEVGLGDVMVWDTERPYHYARWTADHRLLMGGEDRPVEPGQRRGAQFVRATADLRRHFESLLPALADIPTEDAWEGLFALTPDSLPYIGPHRRYPRHLFALGYGGNGMTFSFLAARMLLEQWQGVRAADHRLFGFGR